MTVLAKTESGSEYEFTEKDGKRYFKKEWMSGRIESINTPIQIGKNIEMEVYEEGLYGDLLESSTTYHSAPVREITVMF